MVIFLSDMAERTFGIEGKVFASALYLFMLFIVFVVYISKGVEILDGVFEIGLLFVVVMFIVGLGGMICLGGFKVVDKLN